MFAFVGGTLPFEQRLVQRQERAPQLDEQLTLGSFHSQMTCYSELRMQNAECRFIDQVLNAEC
jgi:hypothetical protein